LTTVGVLTSSIAHELGTPLNVVAARARMIESREIDGEDALRSARIIGQQAERMTGSIRQLLDYARKPTPKQALVDLRQVAQQTCDLFGALAVRHSVSIELRLGPDPMPARVDPGQIQQALSNIVLNGIQAMPGGGPLVVAVAAAPDPAGARNAICMSVEDHGAGIAPENVGRVFESFFTTKADSGGTGLGLSIAHEIVAEHRGRIEIDSTPGKGSRFRIFLPERRE
jgi:signal transduction histidine kinase